MSTNVGNIFRGGRNFPRGPEFSAGAKNFLNFPKFSQIFRKAYRYKQKSKFMFFLYTHQHSRRTKMYTFSSKIICFGKVRYTLLISTLLTKCGLIYSNFVKALMFSQNVENIETFKNVENVVAFEKFKTLQIIELMTYITFWYTCIVRLLRSL